MTTTTQPVAPIAEDRSSPAPWTYLEERNLIGVRDWIADNDGIIVLENVGPVLGPRIVRAVNEMATRDGILS